MPCSQANRWEEKDVFNPAAVVRDGKVFLVYRAEDKTGKYAGTSRLGLASSDDDFIPKKNALPVLHPDEDSLKIYAPPIQKLLSRLPIIIDDL